MEENEENMDLALCMHPIYNYDHCPFLSAIEPRDCNDCDWQDDMKDE